MVSETLYQHTGLVVVRASTDPGGLELPEDVDLDAEHPVMESGRAWLVRIWQRGEVQAALRSRARCCPDRSTPC